MITYEGMKSEPAGRTSYPMLEEGPYIAEIRDVHIDGQVPNQTLILRMDIIEGEHKDYFTNRYKAESAKAGRYPAKYRGDFKLRIPHPNSNSKYPDSDKRNMNDAIFRLEQSNPDFHWDGDEKKLKGLQVGINMQKGEFNDIQYTSIGRLEIVEDIRKGLVKPMKPRKPRYSETAAGSNVEDSLTPVEDVEIPF